MATVLEARPWRAVDVGGLLTMGGPGGAPNTPGPGQPLPGGTDMEERRHEKDSDDQVHEVVRAHRFELIDPENRVRAVLGDISRGYDEFAPGITMLDADGQTRLWLGVLDHAVLLSIDHEGSTILELGVNQGSDAVIPGPYLVLCDGTGAPVVRWRVDLDGEAVVEPPRQEP